MIQKNTNRQWIGSLIAATFSGLFTAQSLAALYIHLPRKHLYSAISTLENTGHFTAPGCSAMQVFTIFEIAFSRGLFFAMSIGAGLSLLTSPHIPERHRLVRARGNSRSSQTDSKLTAILHPHPNFICHAFFDLEKRKNTYAIQSLV